jgi:hypothetical protein
MSNSLIDSLNKTNLDTEDLSPSGGPINAPQYNFKTKYSSKSKYETPGTQVSPLRHSLGITALDAENNAAGVVQGGSGGPINAPQYNFLTKYSSTKPYETPGTQASPLSASSLQVTALDVESKTAGIAQGGSGGPAKQDAKSGFLTRYSSARPYFEPGVSSQEDNKENALIRSLSVTALDIENPQASIPLGGSGGPQRNNSYNRYNTIKPDGTYEIKNASALPLSPTPGGPAIQTKDNKPATYQLQQYTPEKTYMQSLKDFAEGNMGEI